MATTAPNDTTILFDAIRRGVQQETERRWEEYKKEFLEKLERDKDMIVAGIVLDVMQHVKMETMGREMVVTVRKIEDKKV